MRTLRLPFATALLLACVQAASAVIFLQTDDPQHNTSTPGDNSGWQYEGQFGSFLGTPIAPRFFVTAQHIGGSIGDPFYFHGATYTTTAAFSDPESDLRIWEVDQDFADYAPLHQNADEVGRELRVHGRGTQRGDALTDSGDQLHGWRWGPADSVQRWGRNLVAGTAVDSSTGYPFLQATFDSPGLPDEAHLSSGDSAGGIFILEDGLWKLAAVNYGVDEIATLADGSDAFPAAVFDARGYYIQDSDNRWIPAPDNGSNVPTSFYGTRISSRLDWIGSVIGTDTASQLAPETYSTWLGLYFTPNQIDDVSITGLGADPDGDGVPNLLEYAFNLDPTYPEPALMVADTGVRGLPLILPSTGSDSETRLTVEYVRRTAASNPGITYTVQWTSDLAPDAVDWQPGGIESVAPINARWERVKTTDSVALNDSSPARFARVLVTLSPPAESPAMRPVARGRKRVD